MIINPALDNPAWYALHSGNKHLAMGTEPVVYFDPAVAPFVAIPEPSQFYLDQLYQTLPFDGPIVLISREPLTISSPWQLVYLMEGYQMIFTKSASVLADEPNLIALTEEHVPQMLALTQLTQPGPFLARTIDFGHYEGIMDGGQLVAMAGQRLHANEFAEISAVCTHPDHLGKGYARHLLMRQINRIQAAAGMPFLHVRTDNERAIGVYQGMGFDIRSDIYFYVLRKEQS